jgi:hypothetical protein
MDLAVTRAVSQLYHGSRYPMSASETRVLEASVRRRIRNGVLGLGCLALTFYLGFIALLVLRSHH